MPTSRSNSVVDYAIGSLPLLACAKEFEVLVFDRLFSDIHSPVHVVLKGKKLNEQSQLGDTSVNHDRKCTDDHCFKTVWDEDKKEEFVNNLDKQSILSILPGITQDCDVNEMCDKIAGIFTESAKETFKSVCVTCPRKPPRNDKPWFTAQCAEARVQYRRVKGRLKLDRTNTELQVEMANANTAYKRVLRKARCENRRANVNRIRQLKNSNPKMYWKALNSKKRKPIYHNLL